MPSGTDHQRLEELANAPGEEPHGLPACARVHRVLDALPAFTSRREARSRLGFTDGLYFFYESGETSAHGPEGRIVRVGNHPRSDGTLWRRLGQHYSDGKNGSVFRKFLGGALLRRDDPDSPCLEPAPGQGHWERQGAAPCPSCRSIDERVSALLRERFWFRCLPVPNRAERNALEHQLIATVAACSACAPSPDWLGRWAYSTTVCRAGMWNSQGVGEVPLNAARLARLEKIAASGGDP